MFTEMCITQETSTEEGKTTKKEEMRQILIFSKKMKKSG